MAKFFASILPQSFCVAWGESSRSRVKSRMAGGIGVGRGSGWAWVGMGVGGAWVSGA